MYSILRKDKLQVETCTLCLAYINAPLCNLQQIYHNGIGKECHFVKTLIGISLKILTTFPLT